jgi:hypothetical protein
LWKPRRPNPANDGIKRASAGRGEGFVRSAMSEVLRAAEIMMLVHIEGKILT